MAKLKQDAVSVYGPYYLQWVVMKRGRGTYVQQVQGIQPNVPAHTTFIDVNGPKRPLQGK